MINHATIALITRLFDAGEEIPAIAAAAKCHPNTVRTVIAGEHRLQVSIRDGRHANGAEEDQDIDKEERERRIDVYQNQVAAKLGLHWPFAPTLHAERISKNASPAMR